MQGSMWGWARTLGKPPCGMLQTEFMSDAHIFRIQASPRRNLLFPALQSVQSSMDSQQTSQQTKAYEESERATKDAILSFLLTSIVPKIRLGDWSVPIPLPEPQRDWPHWEDLKTAAENFWTKEGWCISKKKQNPFVQMVREAFWDIVLMRGEPGATAGLGTYGIDPHRAQRAGRCCRRWLHRMNGLALA